MSPNSPDDQTNIEASVIGPDLTITGDLETKGRLRVDGEVKGQILGATVVIGESGRVTGGILAEEIFVFGQVMGSIRGSRVTLQSSSHVEADILCESLVIEQGASFEGKSQRSEKLTAEPTPRGAAFL